MPKTAPTPLKGIRALVVAVLFVLSISPSSLVFADTGTGNLRQCQRVAEIKSVFSMKSASGDYSAYDVLQENYPRSLTVDSKGNIYVGNSVEYEILKFDAMGRLLFSIPLQPPVLAKKNEDTRSIVEETGYVISAMARDKLDNIYAYNRFESRIEVYSSGGKHLRDIPVWLTGKLSLDRDQLSVDTEGNIYVSNNLGTGGSASGEGLIFSPNGKPLYERAISAKKWHKLYKASAMVGYSGLMVGNTRNKQLELALLRNGKEIDRCRGTWIDSTLPHYVDQTGRVYALALDTKNNVEDLVVRVIQMNAN